MVMTRTGITTELKKRLAQGGIGLSGVWPNVDPQSAKERPHFDVQWATANRIGPSVSADVLYELGSMAVTIVVRGGTNETIANGYADAVVALFPQGLELPITDGLITIVRPADIRGGYRDDQDWRVPVIIYYEAVED